MNLVCLACDTCLFALSAEPGDRCPEHRESRVERTREGGTCSHHDEPYPARNRAERRARRRSQP